MTHRQILLNTLTIAVAVGLPHLELTPLFSYSVPILLLVWLALRSTGERFSDIGFRIRSCTRGQALVGSLAAAVTLGGMQLVVFPVVERFVEFTSNDIGIEALAEAGLTELLFLITASWLIGGVYEEIVFHGFLFTRLEKMIPGEGATAWSFVLTSVFFGAYHLQMGTAGAFNALLVGAVGLGLYLRFGRSLWASIIYHGVYNTLVLTLIHLGYL